MKYLTLCLLALLFVSCSSDPVEEKPVDWDEKKREWDKETAEWKVAKELLDKQNTQMNQGSINATRPQLKIDQEQLKKTMTQAMAGDAEAQYRLGIDYKYGVGVPQSNDTAIFWFKKAAEQGHAQAKRVYMFMEARK
jgi:TPR repeat protein